MLTTFEPAQLGSGLNDFIKSCERTAKAGWIDHNVELCMKWKFLLCLPSGFSNQALQIVRKMPLDAIVRFVQSILDALNRIESVAAFNVCVNTRLLHFQEKLTVKRGISHDTPA